MFVILCRMFLTQQYLAFSGWPEGRVLLSLQQIAGVERTTVFFVPNALLVTTTVGEEYFFGSFLDRDQCYNLLTVMVKIAKGLVEMEFYSEHGGRQPLIEEGLGNLSPTALHS